MIITPLEAGAEHVIVNLVLWIKLGVEATGALVIATGVAVATVEFIRSYFRRQEGIDSFTDTRLTLARYLALALEFQVGADILATAVAPSWEQIGKLGAIVVIRTALNYFLTREIREESKSVHSTR